MTITWETSTEKDGHTFVWLAAEYLDEPVATLRCRCGAVSWADAGLVGALSDRPGVLGLSRFGETFGHPTSQGIGARLRQAADLLRRERGENTPD